MSQDSSEFSPGDGQDGHGTGSRLELTVDAMAYGGKGVARSNGKVYFIMDAVVGDRVEARVTKGTSRYGEAEIERLLVPSPLRLPPPCPVATDCGGCQWMGIDVQQQLAWKRSFVTSALERIGKLPNSVPVEILASPSQVNYRNRILLRVHLGQDGALKFGYFRRQSRDLVPLRACAIAAAPINALLAALLAQPFAPGLPLKVRLELQELPADGAVSCLLATVYPAEGSTEAMAAFMARLKSLPQILWAGTVLDVRNAPMLPFDHDLGLVFHTVPGQFQQVNVEHNHALRRLVQNRVQQSQPGRVLDVFCGSGNLSLPLADGHRYIEGVEANKQAIDVAKYNAQVNGLTNVNYLAGDAERHLWKVSRANESFDLVILDPPRQGMYEGMVPLKNLAPQEIIYVSCDPTTLARDLGYLCRKDFYHLEAVTAFDFFPNTYHVETVAILRRGQ